MATESEILRLSTRLEASFKKGIRVKRVSLNNLTLDLRFLGNDRKRNP